MSTENTLSPEARNALGTEDIQQWFSEKLAHKLKVDLGEIDINRPFDEFGLDSTEALLLAGEFENWLGFELSPTALWYTLRSPN